jgi:hypothetical protein
LADILLLKYDSGNFSLIIIFSLTILTEGHSFQLRLKVPSVATSGKYFDLLVSTCGLKARVIIIGPLYPAFSSYILA